MDPYIDTEVSRLYRHTLLTYSIFFNLQKIWFFLVVNQIDTENFAWFKYFQSSKLNFLQFYIIPIYYKPFMCIMFALLITIDFSE
jgi:hypothetical protein